MNKLIVSNFNFYWTLLGGQSFGWDYYPESNTFIGFTQDKAIKLITPEKEPNILYWQTYPVKDNFEFIKSYLRLDVNYEFILKKINKDNFINTAIQTLPNLRLLHQGFEETLLSFLISPNNNIRSIRTSIRKLNYKFGEKLTFDNTEIYLFPKTEILADADLNELLESRIGFRAKNVKAAAEFLIKSNISKEIINYDYNKARETLIEFKGIGDKIADCIMVFSLIHDNITPLDVWGKRFLIDYYNLDPKMNYDEMSEWIANYFEGYTSWAGQFLFEYIRNLPRKI